MRICLPSSARQNASVLIIVLWICIGLVSITLYFANSMTYELQAADNRVKGLSADQAVEGAARYVSYVLSVYATNGAVPDPSQFSCENVAIGDAHYWIIGRDPSGTPSTEPYFGLVDEGSKLNMNRVGTNTLSYLPNMEDDYELALNIVDWRSTNGVPDPSYAAYGYAAKEAPFETVDELHLVDGATEDLLVGDDVNRNGVLDANEKDTAGNGQVEYGLFEYLTVYSREPNFHSDGSLLTNINSEASSTGREQLEQLFQNASLSTSWADTVYSSEHPAIGNGANYTTLLGFYLYCKQAFSMTSAQFATIYDNITVSNSSAGNYIKGRVNINTARAEVLTALFEGSTGGTVDESTAESAAETMVTYREQNPDSLQSVAWMVDALGSSSPVVLALRTHDVITTHSYQFSADIAAVGGLGRGYRRVKFIFDTSQGPPIILYRQDLSRLGWALGTKARQSSMAVATK